MWSLKAPRRVLASGVREENSELWLQAAPNLQTAVSRPVPDRQPLGAVGACVPPLLCSLRFGENAFQVPAQFSGNAAIPLCHLCVSGPLWTDSVILYYRFCR